MRDRRGAVGRLTGLVEAVAVAARRRQRGRAPRVLLYDVEGHPRLLRLDSPQFDAIVDAAERMIELADGWAEPGEASDSPHDRSSTGGVSVPDVLPQREGEAEPEGGRRDES